jgi:hypothetical protein
MQLVYDFFWVIRVPRSRTVNAIENALTPLGPRFSRAPGRIY